SSFQYLIVAAVFSVGKPFRQPLYKNAVLVTCLVALCSLSLYFMFTPEGFFFDLLGLVEMPRSFHWALFWIVTINLLCCFLYAWVLLDPTVRSLKAIQRMRWRRRSNSRERYRRHGTKVYKVVEIGMREDSEV
ncbi:hypothetical protein IE53DRAFT_321816, partial [Violaceomyces palustris]